MTPSPARPPWLLTDAGIACSALPGIVALLGAGILLGSPRSGAVAAGGAFTLAFAAFKQVRNSRALTMLLAAAGICVATVVGTLASQSDVTMVAAVLVSGLAAGLLPEVAADLGWVGQQATIFLMVAGNYPGGLRPAAARAGLLLAGGAVQFVIIQGLRALARPVPRPPAWPALVESARAAGATLAHAVRTRSVTFHRAVRLAVVLAAAVETWRRLHLPNGYWMAMTALLLVRPNLRGTFGRAAQRVAGTVIGAALATLLTTVLPRVTAHPSSHWVSAELTAVFALLSLALLPGNQVGPRKVSYAGDYVVFAACLTAYVVYLLHYGGLDEREVAMVRVLLTALGGVFALAVHLPFDRLPRFDRARAARRATVGSTEARSV
ncbi:MAG TPA: FUSC family protein [Gemmatirosa sp.]